MKTVLLLLLNFLFIASFAQTISDEEKALRQTEALNSFLKSVKDNSREDCLCKANEYPVYSIKLSTGKTASLCVSKTVTQTTGYLVYRFGSNNKIELSFPSDTLNSFSQFSYSTYSRGGGKQNAAMYINNLSFANGGYTYRLYDNWSSEDNRESRGIQVTNKDGKSFFLDAKGKARGTLFAFSHGDVVKQSDEL